MQPSAPPPPPSAIEMHSIVQDSVLEHKLSPKTEELIRLCPSLVLGTVRFFAYDESKHALVLTPSFRYLLKYLVQIHELNPQVLKASSLSEFNDLLQKSQGFEGGLLRKEGKERWELKDSLLRKKFQPRLNTLFEEVLLCSSCSVSLPLSVDHCILFGAHCGRMKQRIEETLSYLKEGLEVTGHLYLLGSNRQLVPDELELLKVQYERLPDVQKSYWQKLFDKEENQTEANGFLFLWKSTAPEELQKKFLDKLTLIQSSRLIDSCGQKSIRPSTESTVIDWNAYYQEGKPQSVFALVEEPFSRLLDQFRATALTKGKTATRETLIERIKNTSFSFVLVDPSQPPLVSVTLDEIPRNVYRIMDTLNYLESLE